MEIGGQYKKTVLELQYGMSAGGAYPAACLLSAFWAALKYRYSERDQVAADIRLYGAHLGQILTRFNRPQIGPAVVRVLSAKEDYDHLRVTGGPFTASSRSSLTQEQHAMLDFAFLEDRLGISE